MSGRRRQCLQDNLVIISTQTPRRLGLTDITMDLVFQDSQAREDSRDPFLPGSTNVYIEQETDFDFEHGLAVEFCEIAEDNITENENRVQDSSFSVKVLPLERTHAMGKPIECDICKKTFARNSALTVHRRTHTGEKPFECDICKKNYTCKSALSIHRRTHTGEKPFECDICNKAYTCRSALSVHSRTHTGEKPYEYRVCQKQFTTSSDFFKHHQRKHTGELFQCQVCEKRFTFSSDFSKHQRKHTGEQFPCQVCENDSQLITFYLGTKESIMRRNLLNVTHV
ncbi:hypothetical protein QYM36_009828 [Artemia franciscana]|uniref:C2H2-type domain-containing protein n=2 Tax=Artemia franciscana TaxID=6661 RepID=A0AA88HVK7_ARTSF|nr:hypothetical protein QYM36_009828 [Artemia franciscana]